jgi:hypothetical protein
LVWLRFAILLLINPVPNSIYYGTKPMDPLLKNSHGSSTL